MNALIINVLCKISSLLGLTVSMNRLVGNSIIKPKSLFWRTKITIRGRENTIKIEAGSRLSGCRIKINGSNNYISIGRECRLKDTTIYVEDANNSIELGAFTTIAGYTSLDCIEGTAISIGSDCMLSKDIEMRTGDGHSIVDKKGSRINPSKDICIGNHVWIGRRVTILKGVELASDSIVGIGSLVTQKFKQSGVILAGIPAQVSKKEISWRRRRL